MGRLKFRWNWSSSVMWVLLRGRGGSLIACNSLDPWNQSLRPRIKASIEGSHGPLVVVWPLSAGIHHTSPLWCFLTFRPLSKENPPFVSRFLYVSWLAQDGDRVWSLYQTAQPSQVPSRAMMSHYIANHRPYSTPPTCARRYNLLDTLA